MLVRVCSSILLYAAPVRTKALNVPTRKNTITVIPKIDDWRKELGCGGHIGIIVKKDDRRTG